MKTNDRTLIVALATLLLAAMLTACEHGELIMPEPTTASKQVPLQLTSGISSTVTRAYDSSWETNDEIGVFTVKAGSTNANDVTRSGTYEDANIRYQLSGTAGNTASGSAGSYTYTYQTFTSVDKVTIGEQEEDKKIYLPIDGSNVDVYAYYPYDGSATASAKTITLETSQTLVGQKGYDLLSACALSSTSAINLDYANVQLLFRHELSKVLIKVVAGEGYNSSDLFENIRVELTGQPTQALFSPLTRELAITTGSNTIVPMKLSSGDADYSKIGSASCIFRALVLPNMTETNPAVSSGQRQIRFYVGAEPNIATYKYNISQTFTAGQETTFTLRLAATGITITAAISAWDTESIDDDQPIYETN